MDLSEVALKLIPFEPTARALHTGIGMLIIIRSKIARFKIPINAITYMYCVFAYLIKKRNIFLWVLKERISFH